MLVQAEKGGGCPVHVHSQDDHVYQLEGRSKMWVEGEGDLRLCPGAHSNPRRK